MSTRLRTVDDALLTEWQEWIAIAVRRFGASGYGESAAALSVEDVWSISRSPNLTFAAALTGDDGSRGIVLVVDSPWETGVLGRAVAKIAWLAADNFDSMVPLAKAALEHGREHSVVLLSASPGHSPLFVHAALAVAGFHVGSQTLTTWEDLEDIAPAVAKIPLRGTFRTATASDADAIAELAYFGFDDQRFTRDPFFPKEWGRRLYSAWARNLVLGAADEVVVAERSGKVSGFVSMTVDDRRRAAVPPLLTIDQQHTSVGTGAMLMRIMLDWYRARGFRTFVGGTEKSNTAINALHVRLGGSFIDSNIVYHATPGLRNDGGAP